MNNDDKFDYTYSAPTENERREIESIRSQYAPATQSDGKLERLRRLNKRVTRPPLIIGIVTGVLGLLVMGAGMAMVLEWNIIVRGIIVGLSGLAIAAVAYPVYRAVLGRNKRKYGRQIIELSNELLNTEQNEKS